MPSGDDEPPGNRGRKRGPKEIGLPEGAERRSVIVRQQTTRLPYEEAIEGQRDHDQAERCRNALRRIGRDPVTDLAQKKRQPECRGYGYSADRGGRQV